MAKIHGPQDPYLIAVMGPTGVGKSTFINLASHSSMKVSSGLKSCTVEVTPTAPFRVDGKEVILLDTPGFDDTSTSDFDILEEIASYMAKKYQQHKLLDGILYFHNISGTRMGGSAVRNLRLFESLCGEDPFQSVVVVTNMWGLLHNEQLGNARERELEADPVFFGKILKGGATLMRHHDKEESSRRIISFLINQRSTQSKLAIQTEMVDDNLRLDETTAAAELIKDFDTMIQNLRRRIEKEGRPRPRETTRQRKERERAIKKMEHRIQQLEERKVNIGRRNGSLWLHAAFLRWIRSMFS